MRELVATHGATVAAAINVENPTRSKAAAVCIYISIATACDISVYTRRRFNSHFLGESWSTDCSVEFLLFNSVPYASHIACPSQHFPFD